jgi:hypothetical protein
VKKSLWAGRVLSALAILFLLFDGVLHVLNPPAVVEASTRLGYPPSLAIEIGIIELLCLIVYAIPRTSILGAILLTGYLGGAIASHLRVLDPVFETTFPILVGAMLWGGIFLLDARLRSLVPFRR